MFIDDLPMYGYVGEVRAGTTFRLLLLFGLILSASRKQTQGVDESETLTHFRHFGLRDGGDDVYTRKWW